MEIRHGACTTVPATQGAGARLLFKSRSSRPGCTLRDTQDIQMASRYMQKWSTKAREVTAELQI